MTRAVPDSLELEAVVLSGGGAQGAYEVGVMQALLGGLTPASGYRPVDPAVLCGTSVGAYNAAVLACNADRPGAEAADVLARIWRQRIASRPGRCGNGVYRLRGNPRQLLDPACLLQDPARRLGELARDAAFFARAGLAEGARFVESRAPLYERTLEGIDLSALLCTEPLWELVEHTIDQERLAASRKKLRVAVSNWDRGEVRVFSEDDVAARKGRRAIVASAALPGIFLPVEIEGERYVDGGVLMDTPLGPAIQAGARIVHVVNNPPDFGRDPHLLPGSVRSLYRMNCIIWSSGLETSCNFIQAWNRLLGKSLSRDALWEIAEMLLRAEAGTDHPHPIEPFGPITVHRYVPSQALGRGAFDLLNFDLRKVERLLELGRSDAVRHDCRAAGCLLPEAEAPSGRPMRPPGGRPA